MSLVTLSSGSGQGASQDTDHSFSSYQQPSTLTEIAKTYFDELGRLMSKEPESQLERMDVFSVACVKSHKWFFKYDNALCQLKLREDLDKYDIENLNHQIKDLMKTAELADASYIINILKKFHPDDLMVLQEFFKFWKQGDVDFQLNERSPKLHMFLQEVDGWSIVFNRYEKFGSYLSDVIKNGENQIKDLEDSIL